VFLLAVLVRAVYLYQSSDNPTFRAPVVDSLTYDQMARRVVEGEGITDNFFWQPLFYPLFVSMVYWLSNSSILCVKIVQAVLGAVTCVLAYRVGGKIFGRLAGILAGAITAVYMPLVFFEGELLAAGWAAFWSVATVLTLIKAAEKPKVSELASAAQNDELANQIHERLELYRLEKPYRELVRGHGDVPP